MAVETDHHDRTTEEAASTPDRNGVAVEFADGAVRRYAVVVRPRDGDWFHAERLVGDGDGFDDEEIEAINPDSVTRIRSDQVHRCGTAAVHIADGLLVDPERLAAEWA
ncbi:MAG: hypothetical protein ABEH64_00295 [Salinirussus sp.]